MANFKLFAVNHKTGEETFFTYDNMNSVLLNEAGNLVVNPMDIDSAVRPRNISKVNSIKKLKISLGLSCNYECSYCSQRFVPHSDAMNKDDIEPFLSQLPTWFNGGEDGLGYGTKIEFWGGEPLVYIKTLKPLAERLRKMYPNAEFGIVTNGSLLNPELNQWIDEMGFGVGISHDGPGQPVRGPDPLEDEKSREGIFDLYRRLKPQGRISINAMLNNDNSSRRAIQEQFKHIFGDDVVIGEGGFVDAYDEGGIQSSIQSSEDQLDYRIRSLSEMRDGHAINFDVVRRKLIGFIESLAKQRKASNLGQKCGMDNPENIAVNLKGEVLTCQNVSSSAIAPNGQSHKAGSVYDFENIRLRATTYWPDRKECPNCPVLQLCKGSCMFLEGELWDVSCNSAFNDNIVFLVGAIEILTGFTIQRIEGPQREDRQEIWKASEKPKRKVIPIFATH